MKLTEWEFYAKLAVASRNVGGAVVSSDLFRENMMKADLPIADLDYADSLHNHPIYRAVVMGSAHDRHHPYDLWSAAKEAFAYYERHLA
jgi:hypothetical protein